MTWRKRFIKNLFRLRFLSTWPRRLYEVVLEEEESLHASLNTRKDLEILLWYLKPKVRGLEFSRFGSDYDGGYVVHSEIAPNTVCISAGIAEDSSFEQELSNYIELIHMVDYSIESEPAKLPNGHFHKKKLVGFATSSNELTLNYFFNDEAYMNKRFIVKMDIEGSEWEVLRNLSDDQIDRIDQLIVELHDVILMIKTGRIRYLIECLEKISRRMLVFNVHGNNASEYGIFLNAFLANVVEVSFINRRLVTSSDERLPHNLNQPNKANRADLIISLPL